MEEYDLEQMETAQNMCRLCLKILGLNWQSDRVQGYLAKVGERLGIVIKDPYGLPFEHYRNLAIMIGKITLEDHGHLAGTGFVAEYYRILVAGKQRDTKAVPAALNQSL